MDICVHN